MVNKVLTAVAIAGAVSTLFWIGVVAPELTSNKDILELTSENVGMIQFADTVGGELSEPTKMIFEWKRNVIEEDGGNAVVKTTYNYKDIVTDESFWITEFTENVDLSTRKYLDKTGHIMFPNYLEKKDYSVYDIGGAVLDYKFEGVDEIDNLTVYKFTGKTTFDVSDVYPDFEHVIYEEYTATNFIEPTTGVEIAFYEQFTDYALIDGKKVIVLDAWDEPTSFSEITLIKRAKDLKTIYEIYNTVIPSIIIATTAIVLLAVGFQQRNKKSQEKITELKATEKQKDEFVSMLGHEIKNPLTPIMGMCDMLLSEADGSLTEGQKRRIQTIQNSSKQLNDLLSDLSEVKKIELEKISLSKTELDIREYLENVIESVRPFTGDKNVHIQLEISDTWNIKCDQKRISQVISNLVKNAIDFVPEDNGKIIISADKTLDGTTFVVQDNGIGIMQSAADLVFEKFKQIDTPKNIKHEGTGLGLSICKGIIEAHDGQIWLDKEYHDGARFKFFIPN